MGWLRKILRKNQLARRVYCESFTLRYFWERMHLSAGKSFAQDGEDLKIKDLIGEVRWFVDVGAHDGISGSNTFYFALRGARGLCFEPVRETFHKLRALYRFDRRVRWRDRYLEPIGRLRASRDFKSAHQPSVNSICLKK